MKKRIFITLFLILVLIWAYRVVLSPRIAMNEKTFQKILTIKKKENIDRIEIRENENLVLLEKNEEAWLVNQKHKADPQSIDLFFQTLERMLVRSRYASDSVSAFPEKTIRIYMRGKLFREFRLFKLDSAYSLIGIEKHDVFFYPRVIGYSGNVYELFPLESKYWRKRMLFDFVPAEILEISIKYPEKSPHSFLLKRMEDEFQLQGDHFSYKESELSAKKLSQYLSYFAYSEDVEYLSAFPFETEKDQKNNELASIGIRLLNDKKLDIVLYRIPVENRLDEFGNKVEYDLNYVYLYHVQNAEWARIKYFQADLFLKQKEYFIDKN